ncbi:unnamed protein product, partial [Iphiclides podalirius]
MRRELVVLLAAVTLTVAMVPRLRRAVNLDEDEELKKTSPPSQDTQICMPQTPCAWSIYKLNSKIIETRITNGYCNCDVGTLCLISEDDRNVGAFIHRCRAPVENDETAES